MLFFGKKKLNQIWVIVKGDPIDRTVKRNVETSSDGLKSYVVLEKPTPDKVGWKVDVTGCVRMSTSGQYAEVVRGSNRGIKYDLTNSTYNLSKLTNDEQKQFINLQIFKSHYARIIGDLLNALRPYLIGALIVGAIAAGLAGFNAYQINELTKLFYVGWLFWVKCKKFMTYRLKQI